MKLTPDVIDVWELALCSEDTKEMQLAAIHLARTRSDSAFMPTVGLLISTARELRKGITSTASEAWARGPSSKDNTTFESDVWKTWGGVERWRFLPDPRYAEDSGEAQQVLSFARKEFVELYDDMQNSQFQNQEQLTHSEAVGTLAMLNRLAIAAR